MTNDVSQKQFCHYTSCAKAAWMRARFLLALKDDAHTVITSKSILKLRETAIVHSDSTMFLDVGSDMINQATNLDCSNILVEYFSYLLTNFSIIY